MPGVRRSNRTATRLPADNCRHRPAFARTDEDVKPQLRHNCSRPHEQRACKHDRWDASEEQRMGYAMASTLRGAMMGAAAVAALIAAAVPANADAPTGPDDPACMTDPADAVCMGGPWGVPTS